MLFRGWWCKGLGRPRWVATCIEVVARTLFEWPRDQSVKTLIPITSNSVRRSPAFDSNTGSPSIGLTEIARSSTDPSVWRRSYSILQRKERSGGIDRSGGLELLPFCRSVGVGLINYCKLPLHSIVVIRIERLLWPFNQYVHLSIYYWVVE